MTPEQDIIGELLPDDALGKDLYHYTSAEGLMGIIGQGKIRCSHVFYLSDSTENLDAWSVFFSVLEECNKNGSYDPAFYKAIEQVVSSYRGINFDNISNNVFEKLDILQYWRFVFCLSLQPDDQSQWRSYTPEKLGFSIHFRFDNDDKTELRVSGCSQNHRFRVVLRRCIYERSDKVEKMRRLLNYYFQQFSNKVQYWDTSLYFHIQTLSMFFKNPNFKSEQECRMVVVLEDGSWDLLKLRLGRSFLVPYIELDTIQKTIKGITVGSTPSPNQSIAALRALLKNSGFYHCLPVDVSKVPYRAW